MKDESSCMENTDSVHLCAFTIAQSLITLLHTFIHYQMLCLEGTSRGHLVPPSAQGKDQLDWNYSWQMFASPVLRVLRCSVKSWGNLFHGFFLLTLESFSNAYPRFPWMRFKPITTWHLPCGHRELFILFLFLSSICMIESFYHVVSQSLL